MWVLWAWQPCGPSGVCGRAQASAGHRCACREVALHAAAEGLEGQVPVGSRFPHP